MSTSTDPAAASSGRACLRSRWPGLLLPLSALLLGLLVGAGIVAASYSSDPDIQGAPAPSSLPTAPSSSPGDGRLPGAVPAVCLQAATAGVDALDAVERGLGAVRSWDAAQLRGVLRQLEDAQPRLRALAEQCRSAAAASTLSTCPAPSVPAPVAS